MEKIKTVCPVPMEQLKQYFSNKENYIFEIDYNNSALQGDKLLTYLSNIDIPCDIDPETINNEQLESLLTEYITNTNTLINVPLLVTHALVSLLTVKSDNNVVWDCPQGFSKEQTESFVTKNYDALRSMLDVIESTMLYNISTITCEELKEDTETFNKVEDKNYCGINFVWILKRPEFIHLIENVDKNKQKYYVHQYDKYIYKGKCLYDFWMNSNNHLALFTALKGDVQEFYNKEDNINAPLV
jgi:hypothetical protein